MATKIYDSSGGGMVVFETGTQKIQVPKTQLTFGSESTGETFTFSHPNYTALLGFADVQNQAGDGFANFALAQAYLEGFISVEGGGWAYEVTQRHTSGATATIGDKVQNFYVTPTTTLSALTITLPTTPTDNQEINISFGGGSITVGIVVTTLSFVGDIVGGSSITTALAGDFYTLKYDSTGYWRVSFFANYSRSGRVIEVNNIADLPAPVADKITLPSTGSEYKFLSRIDLGGLEINFGNNSIRGISQEISGIDNAIIELTDTVTLSDIRFTACEMTINAPLGAYDWNRVNFYDCTLLDVIAADNIVMETIGFINSENFQISGTLNSLILSPNCIWRSLVNPTGTYFTVKSTAVINRRIRIQDSVFQPTLAGQKAIVVEPGATIADESFLLKVVRFVGDGTALTGINGDDLIALFSGCSGTGVLNSAAIGQMYMRDNASPTVILAIDTETAVVGTTLSNGINQRIEHDAPNNALTITSPITRTYRITATIGVKGNANQRFGGYICICPSGDAFNPVTQKRTVSEAYIASSTGTRPDTLTIIDGVDLNTGDKVYCAVENDTAANNIIVEYLNVIVESTSI